MCILTQPVSRIAKTKIFVSELSDNRRATIYQMEIAAPTAAAMVLPVPVDTRDYDPDNPDAEDIIDFIDLSDYRQIFDDMERSFPQADRPRGITKLYRSPLPTVPVGDYVASFVPNYEAFERLDPLFRLSPTAVTAMQRAADYRHCGFAVFQLRDIATPTQIQPMAYTYCTNRPRQLFFPTLHLHDGHDVPEVAEFDHQLYMQQSQHFDTGWKVGTHEGALAVSLRESHGLLRRGRRLLRGTFYGKFPNRDTIIEAVL
jgi:hypothetical protein